jgi:hypothetical protein
LVHSPAAGAGQRLSAGDAQSGPSWLGCAQLAVATNAGGRRLLWRHKLQKAEGRRGRAMGNSNPMMTGEQNVGPPTSPLRPLTGVATLSPPEGVSRFRTARHDLYSLARRRGPVKRVRPPALDATLCRPSAAAARRSQGHRVRMNGEPRAVGAVNRTGRY